MRHCPFCGGKIAGDATECKHCGKTLSAGSNESPGKSTVNLDAWEERRIPSWIVYLLVALSLFCLWLIFAEGCSGPEEQKAKEKKTTFNFLDSPASSGYLE